MSIRRCLEPVQGNLWNSVFVGVCDPCCALPFPSWQPCSWPQDGELPVMLSMAPLLITMVSSLVGPPLAYSLLWDGHVLTHLFNLNH